MISFDDAGIRNVALKTGYVERQTRRGLGVAFIDIDGLTEAVCVAMALRSTPLNADEFRYIRKAMGKSQVSIAEYFARTEQSIANWEKAVTPIPRECSVILKQLCLRQFRLPHCINRTLAELEIKTEEVVPIIMSYEAGAWTSNLHPRQSDMTLIAIADSILSSSAKKIASNSYPLHDQVVGLDMPEAWSLKPQSVKKIPNRVRQLHGNIHFSYDSSMTYCDS